MIYLGLIVTAFTEMLEEMISIGSFFLSPNRLYFLLLVVSIVMLHTTKEKNKIIPVRQPTVYLVGFVLFVLFNAVSIFNSFDRDYSIKRLINMVALYSLPLLVYMYLNERNKRGEGQSLESYVSLILFSGVFIALFGLFQINTGWLRTFNETRSILGIQIPRINSIFLDPNFLAYFLIIPWWLLIKTMEIQRSGKKLILRISASVIIFLAIIFTGSRGGLAMIAALIFSDLVYRVHAKNFKYAIYVEPIIMLVLPLGLIATAYFDINNIVLNVGALDSENESGFSRVLAWYSGIMIYLDEPIFGVGIGNFVTLDKGIFIPSRYAEPWVAEKISLLAGHSNVLEVLVETGPFALIGYYLMQVGVYWRVLNAQRIKNGEIFGAARNIIFAASIGNLFLTYHSYFYLLFTGLILFYASKVMCVSEANSRRKL